tara:strand:- start:3360 stop:3467 length:108 start_codon:yes stop_codon:yes gene_type:complete
MVEGIIRTIKTMRDEMASIIGGEPVRLARIPLRRS